MPCVCPKASRSRPAQTTHFLAWATSAVAGNAIGGVVIVSLLNYGQVVAGRSS
jgi:formate/nitrite transporter FocA (FNT family)